ncbi:unnamed protein product [Mytilus edulis]|uniref:Uncharacterized protein n=1 Tax=Mytilus edulis TaxID=6550 RepID=A0A8S3RQA2_MYTED|nr:unnamed protein product [Mytilus edulis]
MYEIEGSDEYYHYGMDQSKTNIPHFKGWTHQRLRRVYAMTLPQLRKEIESSFHDKPHQKVLACVRDVKSWLFCDRPNHVTWKYRKFSTDSWLPEAGQNQIELFDLDITGDNTIPRKRRHENEMFLNFQEYTWGREFLNNPTKSTPKITRWPLTNLLETHKIIDIPIQLVQTEDPGPSCITEMLESEGLIREV